jgi:hypothetical protein
VRILGRLRNRSPRRAAGAAGSAEASSADEERLPIARYDQLDTKQLVAQLGQLSQLDLAAVEAYERSHRERPVVLNRLRWLRAKEPLLGYDMLHSDEIVSALAAADSATVKAVRSYERHHRERREVLAEAARVLPTARASAEQVRAREDKAALVEVGIRANAPATRARPDGPPASTPESRHSPVDRVDTRRDERNEIERLRDEARYRRERLELYRARLYGGRAASQGKLRELERACEGAAARLRRAERAAPPTHPSN